MQRDECKRTGEAWHGNIGKLTLWRCGDKAVDSHTQAWHCRHPWLTFLHGGKQPERALQEHMQALDSTVVQALGKVIRERLSWTQSSQY